VVKIKSVFIFFFLLLPLLAIADSSLDDLVVFIGEKISVKKFEPKSDPGYVIMDKAFKAKYKVLELVHGEFDGKEIEFEVYDHYGRPAFSRYKTVLLFVTKYEDGMYHQKYQFFPVFETNDGYWAGCGSPYAYEPEVHHGDLNPTVHNYSADAYFPLKRLSGKERRRHYPKKRYKIEKKRAYCLKGNAVEELFEVKLKGVLKARGIE